MKYALFLCLYWFKIYFLTYTYEYLYDELMCFIIFLNCLFIYCFGQVLCLYDYCFKLDFYLENLVLNVDIFKTWLKCINFLWCLNCCFKSLLSMAYDLLMTKRGRDKWIDKEEKSEFINEKQKGKSFLVNMNAYDAYWYILYMHKFRGVFLIHLIGVLSSSKKRRLLSPCLILMIPKHSCYDF